MRNPNRRVPRGAEPECNESFELLRQVVLQANAFRDAAGERASAVFTFPAEALDNLVGVVRLRYRGPRVARHPRWKTTQEGWRWWLPVEPERPWRFELARLALLAARYLDLQIAARHEGKGFFPQVGACTYCGRLFVQWRTDRHSCSSRCRARASEVRFRNEFGAEAWQTHEAHRKKKGTTKRCPCASCRARRLKRY
jgi:hypothetical protein